MSRPLDLVVLGLSVTSAWGNGHATTFRSLLRGLAAEGQRVLFLERDVPWYAAHRDLPAPPFCDLALYGDLDVMLDAYGDRLRAADAVIVGSFVPEGAALIDRLNAMGLGALLFYDIDTPVTLAKLDAGDEAYLAARQVPLFDVYLSFAGGEVLQHLERVRGARRAEALYCSVDPEAYPHDPGAARRWDLSYLGTYSDDRQPTLEALLMEPARRLPRLRFVVAGPQYPPIDWPPNVERIEHLAPADHAAFYNASGLTLNVTRAAMRAMGWSPSVRLFEAGACGTPVVSDSWRGLSDLLPPGEAVIMAEGPEDVVRALTLLPEERRAAIGQAARARVLRGHTGAARARELAGIVRDLSPAARSGAAS